MKSLLILSLFIFLISRRNSLLEGDEGGIFSKTQGWKPLFLLKIKIKQNPGLSDSFVHIHQIIMVYLRSIKYLHWSMIMKIKFHIKKNPSKASCRQANYCRFIANAFWKSEGQCYPRKVFLFLLSFKLGNSIPAL